MQSPSPVSTASSSSEILCSQGLTAWLHQEQVSLAFTTYQTNRLFLIGLTADGRLSVVDRFFDRAMGLYATESSLLISTRSQLWQLESVPSPSQNPAIPDRIYAPKVGYLTGDLNVHEIAPTAEHKNIIFVNTLFSCLAILHPQHHFNPIWKPLFISKLAPEDKCHLNGLAVENGVPRYVTACSTTDTAAGWRQLRQNGGVAIAVESGEIICTGLSMPHSPRLYGGKLWLLNSGGGDFGYVEDGKFQPVVFCPGFVRGLAFYKNFAIVGLSKPRDRNFSGLELDNKLAARNTAACCGLMVVDLKTGQIAHWLQLKGAVKELFDIVVLPGVRQPAALGFEGDEIERYVSFPGTNGLVSTRPTVGQVSEAPPQPPSGSQSVRYQMVYHLNAANSIDYDAVTFPSIKKRWQKYKQRGELIGISASVAEQLVGMAIAEMVPETQTAELISLFVVPSFRRQGIGGNLVKILEKVLTQNGCLAVDIQYKVTEIAQVALEPLLKHQLWQPPKTTFLLAQTVTENISLAPWLYKYPLPQTFEIFPWVELTAAEKQQILTRKDYPDALSPFGDDARLEPLNSLGLRYGGEAIGWMVTHRVAPDTIRYSSLFVGERYQKLARGISLLNESIKRQIASDVPCYTFSVAAENKKMLQFVNRHLRPYLTGLGESRIAAKQLRE